MRYKITVNIQNRSERQLPVIIEPWADSYELPSGKTMTIIGTRDHQGEETTEDFMQIDYEETDITVWPLEHSRTQIHLDGEVVFKVGDD